VRQWGGVAGEPLWGKEEAMKRKTQTHMARGCTGVAGIYIDGLKQPESGRGCGSFANMASEGCGGHNAELFRGSMDNRLYVKCVTKMKVGDEVFLQYGTKGAVAVAMGDDKFKQM
jgi:hypothetical protein